MRSTVLLAFLPFYLAAAPTLAIVRPVISQSDGGDALPANFRHTAGETMFFAANISGFTKSAEEQMHLTYTVQAFDPKGVAVAEVFKDEMKGEVGPQDKDWLPKIETQIVMPEILLPGAYKILVKAEDVLAKTSAELAIPFEVGGRNVTPSPTLVAKDFRWYHNEEETRAMAQPAYHAGDSMWMKFVMTGYKYGPKNKVHVSYVASLMLMDGKTIWTQPDPAVEDSEAFYPKPYVTGEFGISLNKDFKPGTYYMVVTLKDDVGKQNYSGKFEFTVQ